MVNMKILDLPLKAKWYEMIESGNKKEEYREIKKYWIGRLAKCGGRNSYEKTGFYCKKAICFSCITRGNGFHPKEYTHVRFRFGYTQRTMLFELESITIGVGNTNWGAPDNECVFILKLGKCIKKMKVRTQQNFNRKTNEEDILQLAVMQGCCAHLDFWNYPTLLEYDNTMFSDTVVISYKSTRKEDGIESIPLVFFFCVSDLSYHYHRENVTEKWYGERLKIKAIKFLIEKGYDVPIY